MSDNTAEAVFFEEDFDETEYWSETERDLKDTSSKEAFFLNKENEDAAQEELRLKNLSDENSDLLDCAIPSSRLKLLQCPRPYREFLPGLRKGRVGIISASGSTGKSFFCLQLAMASAAGGLSVFGEKLPLLTERVRVVYITAEEDARDIEERVFSICVYWKKLFNRGNDVWLTMLEHLRVIPMQGNPPCVFDPKSPTKGLTRLEKLCDDFKPELLIIDPLSQFHRAEENDNGAMTRVMQLFTHLSASKDCAVLINHHMSKGAILSGQGALQQSTRGASALVDSARWMMTMTKPVVGRDREQKTEDSRKVLCAFPKLNNHAPIEPFTLYRGPGGVLDIMDPYGNGYDCR